MWFCFLAVRQRYLFVELTIPQAAEKTLRTGPAKDDNGSVWNEDLLFFTSPYAQDVYAMVCYRFSLTSV